MKTLHRFVLVCAIASLSGIAVADTARFTDDPYSTPVLAQWGKKGCSVRDITGKWLFATSVGRQMLPGLPPDKNMTAIGTWNVRPDGSMNGTFDLTVQDTFFMAGIPYEGSVVINADCTGTITFATPESTRTDTIVVVGRNEIIGMSQDPFNLWTYQVRRVPSFYRWR